MGATAKGKLAKAACLSAEAARLFAEAAEEMATEADGRTPEPRPPTEDQLAFARKRLASRLGSSRR